MLGAAEEPMLNNPPISYDLCGQGQASKPHLYFKSLARFRKNRILQGVPYHWIHFVFVNFSGSRAHSEELFIAIE